MFEGIHGGGCHNILSYYTSNMCQYYGTTMQLGVGRENFPRIQRSVAKRLCAFKEGP